MRIILYLESRQKPTKKDTKKAKSDENIVSFIVIFIPINNVGKRSNGGRILITLLYPGATIRKVF